MGHTGSSFGCVHIPISHHTEYILTCDVGAGRWPHHHNLCKWTAVFHDCIRTWYTNYTCVFVDHVHKWPNHHNLCRLFLVSSVYKVTCLHTADTHSVDEDAHISNHQRRFYR